MPTKSQIAESLSARFSMAELRVLLHKLGVEPDEISANPETRDSFAWSIVGYFERRSSLDDLARAVERDRSGVFGAAKAAAGPASPSPAPATARTEVFISYSRADSNWLARIQKALAPLSRSRPIEFWDDTKIKPGMEWRKEIEAALGRARIALLLVSADFLASDFIINHELPPLLDRAAADGVRIIPVLLRPCLFQLSELSKYQSIPGPDRALSGLSANEVESELVKLAMTLAG